MDLDRKDRRILFQLEFNARQPASSIAKKVRLPKQVVGYRIKQMVARGVLKGFRTLVDLHRLGFFTYRVYIRFQNVSPENEKPLLERLSSFKNLIWLVSSSGRWDSEMLFAARNNVHFASILMELKKELGGYLKDYVISPSIINYHFKRRYLSDEVELEKIHPSYGLEPPLEKIDKKDFAILKAISQDASASLTDIGAKVGLTYNGAKKRIAALEKRGIVKSYRTWLELSKMGRHFYKALISLSNFDEKIEKSLIAFCNNEPSIAYLVECTGNWDLEIEAEVKDEQEFRELLVRFRNRFKDIVKDYEILNVYKEHKMDYFPFEKYEDLRMG
ncbi:MAG: Lrp/AsnC family transcriptional regulator [Candidatus Micrarchaeota archaeon]|nr:Lrp/AsnC family transcriptional regulator [Candidatus Micrarchaeota archaeon]